MIPTVHHMSVGNRKSPTLSTNTGISSWSQSFILPFSRRLGSRTAALSAQSVQGSGLQNGLWHQSKTVLKNKRITPTNSLLNHQNHDVKPLARGPPAFWWWTSHSHTPAEKDNKHFSHKLSFKVTILVKYKPFEDKGFYASVKYMHW